MQSGTQRSHHTVLSGRIIMGQQTADAAATDRPIRIGISTCLLGEPVRYDGGHKHDRFITGTLAAYFDWVPVCPEVDIDLGIPRPTIRLERHNEDIRLVMPDRDVDLTDKMRSYAKARVRALEKDELSGYLLKKNSPSCGMERVRVYGPKGAPSKTGVGRFAEELMRRFPNLPVEEEGRLHDPRLRENWIERVFVYHRLRNLWSGRWTVGELVKFHTAHKFLLMAHSPKVYQELGRLVARAKQVPRAELREQYEGQLMDGLKKIATTRRNANVLQHILGFFKRDLDQASRHELLEKIADYHEGFVPLVVPLTLVNHYVRLLGVDYLNDQVYLHPHPKELALRNHV
jgi:uncharacterized protein YbgA (DUF1722 family)/uncharacterized protein YbbK (DUF523 family)